MGKLHGAIGSWEGAHLCHPPSRLEAAEGGANSLTTLIYFNPGGRGEVHIPCCWQRLLSQPEPGWEYRNQNIHKPLPRGGWQDHLPLMANLHHRKCRNCHFISENIPLLRTFSVQTGGDRRAIFCKFSTTPTTRWPIRFQIKAVCIQSACVRHVGRHQGRHALNLTVYKHQGSLS